MGQRDEVNEASFLYDFEKKSSKVLLQFIGNESIRFLLLLKDIYGFEN